MITYIKGNLLEADAEALVNTVNTVGVMGKGIALQFKQAFPENFKIYEKAHRKDELQLGKILVVPTGQFINPKFIFNFPTKKHWRSKACSVCTDCGKDSRKKGPPVSTAFEACWQSSGSFFLKARKYCAAI